MNEVYVINIFDQSKIKVFLSFIPRKGDTLRVDYEEKIFLIRGIMHDISNENSEKHFIYAEPINENYWKNDI
ncbi:hypothetical protein ACQKTA_07340 [Enterococcus sp. 22-H-5-01]|uniref:hypothetical protein n=1 Tax=Enterococcus sp. 22-H-5-01 TaxID=3418555 RepID=UPI003CFEE175